MEKHHLVAGNITNTLEGYAWPQEPDKENGKFWMKFSLFHGKAPHWVIGTDYEKYSIIWSCYDVISVKSTALSYRKSHTVFLKENKFTIFTIFRNVLDSI